MRIRASIIVSVCLLLAAGTAGAEFPYPPCSGCGDPADYQAYMFNPVVSPPVIPAEIDPLDFRVSSLVDPALPATPEELFGVAGMSVDLAWQLTTGRPDVVIGVLDSGIVYDTDLANKAVLNTGELPLPQGSASYDANGDGLVNVQDYALDSRVADVDGNGLIDPRDLILTFSDGVDDDGNGYTDDICGWDTHEHDNDPFDDVSYGHGSGEAEDSTGEVNNGGGWGIAPNAMFLPVKVSDSFVADSNDFAAGLLFAVDSGVTIVSEALGGLDNTPFARAAVEYAWDHGIPLVASAADEQSYHHMFPAAYDHTFWANSIRPEDGLMSIQPTNLLFSGCTNYGGHAQVAISSTSCSSEATGRSAGIFALMYSQAKNQIDRGLISAHPLTGTPLSPNEAIQLLSMTADDVDFSGMLGLNFDPELAPLFPTLVSERVPSHVGFDKYTGYGRANAAAAVQRIAPGSIPPEADISSPVWFANVDPSATPLVEIKGTAAAWRNSNNFSYEVDWACGVDPMEADFTSLVALPMSGASIQDGLLATFDVTGVEAACLFASTTLPRNDRDDFDESFTVTLRLTVVDTLGNVAQARKNITVYHDPTLRAGFPLDLGVSGDSSPLLVDMNGDGAQEVVFGTADGFVHVIDAAGSELPGWPATTGLLPLNVGAPAYQPSALGSNYRAAIIAAVAAGDLDGDGGLEVVAADMEGAVHVFEEDGSLRAGFPVALDPVFSDPSIRNKANRLDLAVMAAPTLADIDGDEALEILVAGMDRHLYVWNDDGSTQEGFPVLIVDQERMQNVDPVTHQVTWKQIGGLDVGSRGTKLIGSPAVGDIDGDGDVEIVLGSNEEYEGGEEANMFIGGLIFAQLSDSLDLPNSRAYALSHLGNLDSSVAANPSGPFVDGWPVKIGLLLTDLLPTVGHGVNANPILADVDGDAAAEIFINGSTGPAYLLRGDGSSYYGTTQDKYKVLNAMISTAAQTGSDSGDFPYTFGAVGSGAVGDVNSDGYLDFAMPAVGIHRLLDVQAAGIQRPADHHLSVWATRTRHVIIDFPRVIEDFQFLSSPAMADLDGDGVLEIIEGSGGYYLHAFGGTGGQPAGWPKFTGGWHIGSVGVGDLDGDDFVDVVSLTREGRLYAWEESGSYASAGAERVQWATLARDIQRSGNLNSGVPVSPPPAGCKTMFRPVVTKAKAKFKPMAADDKILVKGIFSVGQRSFDPLVEDVFVGFGDSDGPVFEATVTAGLMTTNNKGNVFKFIDKTRTLANGIKKLIIKKKKGLWNFKYLALDAEADTGSSIAMFSFGVGDDCSRLIRACEIAKNGKSMKCKK